MNKQELIFYVGQAIRTGNLELEADVCERISLKTTKLNVNEYWQLLGDLFARQLACNVNEVFKF